MKLVLDSNVLGHAFIDLAPYNERDLPSVQEKRRIARHIVFSDEDSYELHVPSIAINETFNIFIKSQVQNDQIIATMNFLFDLINDKTIILHHPTSELMQKALEIATLKTKDGSHISSYDATFHALAQSLNATFLTDDAKHEAKTRDIIGDIQLLESFSIEA